MRAWDKEIEALTPRLYERRRGFYTAINAIEQVQRDDDDTAPAVTAPTPPYKGPCSR